MARTIRFHLDENCDARIAAGLRLHGIDVTTAAEVGLRHASDESQLANGIAQARVIVTQDTDFLRIASSGRQHPGIIFSPRRVALSGRSSATSTSSGRFTSRRRCTTALNSSNPSLPFRSTAMISIPNFIGSRHVEPVAGQYLDKVEPATGQVSSRSPTATSATSSRPPLPPKPRSPPGRAPPPPSAPPPARHRVAHRGQPRPARRSRERRHRQTPAAGPRARHSPGRGQLSLLRDRHPAHALRGVSH